MLVCVDVEREVEIVLLNKDTGSPLRCLGTNVTHSATGNVEVVASLVAQAN